MKVVLGLSTALYRLGLGKLPCVNSMRCPKGPRSMGSNDNPATSLRSRRLEASGERKNGRARGRHARATSPLACLLLARPFFLVPTSPSVCYAGYPATLLNVKSWLLGRKITMYSTLQLTIFLNVIASFY